MEPLAVLPFLLSDGGPALDAQLQRRAARGGVASGYSRCLQYRLPLLYLAYPIVPVLRPLAAGEVDFTILVPHGGIP